MITDSALQALIDAEAKATKGEWRIESGRDIIGHGRDICHMFGRFEDDQPDDDAAFIAAIRNAAPSLLAELRMYRAAIKVAREQEYDELAWQAFVDALEVDR